MNPDASRSPCFDRSRSVAIPEGQIVTVKWRGGRCSSATAPRRRSRRSEHRLSELRDPQTDGAGQKPEWLIVVGVCTHLGCVPLGHEGNTRAGSARATARSTTPRPHPQGPAPLNLAVPEHVPQRREGDLRSTPPARARRHSRDASHERNLDLRPQERPRALVRIAPADHGAGAFLVRRLSGAAQPQLHVDLRRDPVLHAGRADRHRRRAGDALRSLRDRSVRLGQPHHARRELRLADPLHAHQRRVAVLPRRLHPHVPRHLLRVLQGAARAPVDPRRHHLLPDDGDRLHGLRPALGLDELRRRDSHHQSALRHSACRNRPLPIGCGAATRSAIRRSTGSSRCTTCCRS